MSNVQAFSDPNIATATWRQSRGYLAQTPSSSQKNWANVGNITKYATGYTQEFYIQSGKRGLPYNQYTADVGYQKYHMHPYVNDPIKRRQLMYPNLIDPNPMAGTNQFGPKFVNSAGEPLAISVLYEPEFQELLNHSAVPDSNPQSGAFAQVISDANRGENMMRREMDLRESITNRKNAHRQYMNTFLPTYEDLQRHNEDEVARNNAGNVNENEIPAAEVPNPERVDVGLDENEGHIGEPIEQRVNENPRGGTGGSVTARIEGAGRIPRNSHQNPGPRGPHGPTTPENTRTERNMSLNSNRGFRTNTIDHNTSHGSNRIPIDFGGIRQHSSNEMYNHMIGSVILDQNPIVANMVSFDTINHNSSFSISPGDYDFLIHHSNMWIPADQVSSLNHANQLFYYQYAHFRTIIRNQAGLPELGPHNTSIADMGLVNRYNAAIVGGQQNLSIVRDIGTYYNTRQNASTSASADGRSPRMVQLTPNSLGQSGNTDNEYTNSSLDITPVHSINNEIQTISQNRGYSNRTPHRLLNDSNHMQSLSPIYKTMSNEQSRNFHLGVATMFGSFGEHAAANVFMRRAAEDGVGSSGTSTNVTEARRLFQDFGGVTSIYSPPNYHQSAGLVHQFIDRTAIPLTPEQGSRLQSLNNEIVSVFQKKLESRTNEHTLQEFNMDDKKRTEAENPIPDVDPVQVRGVHPQYEGDDNIISEALTRTSANPMLTIGNRVVTSEEREHFGEDRIRHWMSKYPASIINENLTYFGPHATDVELRTHYAKNLIFTLQTAIHNMDIHRRENSLFMQTEINEATEALNRIKKLVFNKVYDTSTQLPPEYTIVDPFMNGTQFNQILDADANRLSNMQRIERQSRSNVVAGLTGSTRLPVPTEIPRDRNGNVLPPPDPAGPRSSLLQGRTRSVAAKPHTQITRHKKQS